MGFFGEGSFKVIRLKPLIVVAISQQKIFVAHMAISRPIWQLCIVRSRPSRWTVRRQWAVGSASCHCIPIFLINRLPNPSENRKQNKNNCTKYFIFIRVRTVFRIGRRANLKNMTEWVSLIVNGVQANTSSSRDLS